MTGSKKRANEPPACLCLQTNDPAGFTLVDVMAWGALGHVRGAGR